MRAEERFSPRVIQRMREAISEARGNEVFVVGKLGEDGKIASAFVGARGNEGAVPILSPHLEEGDVVIHNHPGGGTHPSDADLSIASRLGNQGIGFYIIDNSLSDVYVVAEPVARREVVELDAGSLAGSIEPGGALARMLAHYEERKSQVGMLRMVCAAFNGEEICAAEAGTGVGKSLAYLLPTVQWAVRNDERVVVSTNTINLQQQLVEKDIPLAKRILGEDPKVVLVKGRANYLCLHRLAEALDEMSLFAERDPELLAIREWARTSETGSRTELSFFPAEELWSRVCSEGDLCLGLRCGRREGCFVLGARREASSAKVLVANHHLLFSDLAVRLAGSGFEDAAVLPPFRRLVLDEAHNIEKAATSFFSQGFSRFTLLRFLGRLLRRRKGKITGLYPALSRSMGRSAHVKRVPDLIGAVEKAAEYLDDACMSLLGDQAAMLLDPAGREAFASSASGAVGGLSQTIRDLGEIFQELFERMDAMGERPEAIDGAGSDALVAECRAQLARLGGVADICDRFRSFDLGKDDIFWLESLSQPSRARANDGDGRDDARGRNRSVRFMITPMDVSPLLRKAIYEPMRTTVFTSATLTVAGSFTFWAGRIGLRRDEAREPVFNTFPSPFDYRENVLFGVPTDAPMPDSAGYKTFLASFIGQSLLASRGAGLVLFTSHALMREIYPSVREILSAHAIPVLKQGDDERARLLDAFRGERSSVLFATDSFWEGIDAPGETLQMVILSRLPFRVPSEPVLRARMTDIEEKGGNPFAELSLPDAIIRLRQGFGRLMRRQDDRGVVLLLDSRIVSRWYGSLFFDSLPPARRLIAPSAKVLRHVREFFGKKRGEEDLDASSSPLGDS